MKSRKKLYGPNGGLFKTVLMVCAVAGSVQALAADEIDGKALEEVTVTGSNIQRGLSNLTSSAPVVEVGSEIIEGVGSISIEDVLNRVPSVTSELTASSNNVSIGGFASNVGVSSTSLRNLGSARTLVLVNGRRYVSGVSANSGYGVDLNTIPTSMIERVDVLTGGQSAIYGSDAIAGVINIITKKDFEGVELNAFGALSKDGGAERGNVDFSFGKNFDRGNAWFSIGLAEQKELRSSKRDFSSHELRFLDDDGDGVRESIAVRDGPAHVPGAALFAGNVAVFGDGSDFNINQPLLDGDFNPLGDTDYDNQNAGRYLVSPFDRFHVASGVTFDISDKSSAEFEVNFAHTTGSTILEPAPLSVVGDVFKVGAGGTTNIDVATSPYFVGSRAGGRLLTALGDTTSLDGARTFRRLSEFGDRAVTNTRDVFRVAGIYNYEFNDDLLLKTSVVYGITSQSQKNSGDVYLGHIRNALSIESDGEGGYQCQDVVARAQGCVPVNPFNTADSLAGKAGITGFSQEAIDYIKIDTGQTAEIKQTVLTSVLSGDLPFAITSVPIGFAAGVEYREEKATETPDSFRQLGLSRDLAVTAIDGEFDVIDVFSEIYAPVTDWLNVGLAARYGDYSTIGEAITYRFGLDSPINDMVFLRASFSRSVRAPNINDLFSTGVTGVAGDNVDACNGITADTPGNIAENCRSIDAINKRVTTDGSFTLVASEANNTRLLETGSLDLEEETADAITAGVVLTPLDSFSVSVDYYNIEIENGIDRVGADVFVDRCYNVTPAAFDATCGGNLIRDTIDGPILNLRSTLINVGTIKTSGLDFEVAYAQDNFNVSFLANYLNKYDVTDVAGKVEKFEGRPQFPELRFTVTGSYDVTERMNIFGQLRYRGETEAFLGDAHDYSEDLNTLDSVVYMDVRASFQAHDMISLYIGSNNLFDTQPDILVRGSIASTIGTNTEPRAYDVIGRQVFAGVKLTF